MNKYKNNYFSYFLQCGSNVGTSFLLVHCLYNAQVQDGSRIMSKISYWQHYKQRRSQGGHGCMSPCHTWKLAFASGFWRLRPRPPGSGGPWTPWGTSVSQTPFSSPRSKFLSMPLITNYKLTDQEHTAQRWNRVSGLRVTGSPISAGSGHGSMCQTRCLSRFWVLTCAFIVAFFLQSNTVSKH